MVKDKKKNLSKSQKFGQSLKIKFPFHFKLGVIWNKNFIITKIIHLQQSPKYKKGVVPPLWPIYIGERKTTFVKTYGAKNSCLYYEHVGGKNGNLMGTWWKHIGNNGIFFYTPHPSNPKGKTLGTLNACRVSHWLHAIFLPKIVCHHFWPRLMAKKKIIWGHNDPLMGQQNYPLNLRFTHLEIFVKIFFQNPTVDDEIPNPN